MTTSSKAERDAANALRGPGRIYTLRDLPLKGITYSSVHIHRLVKAGKFPPPFYMSERRPAWTERSIDEWIGERQEAAAAKRDADVKRRHLKRDQ